jgi:hypothetical protein
MNVLRIAAALSLMCISLPAFGQVDVGAIPVVRESNRVTLKLKYDEKSVDRIILDFENPVGATLKIIGVQTSPNYFVVDFPKSVAAGKAAAIELAYEAVPGTIAEQDIIRIKTDRGIFPIEVVNDREKVVTLSARELVWAVGGAPTAKTVDVSIAKNLAKVVKVRSAGGAGHSATFSDLGAGTYRISITPASLSTPTKFPVFVELDKDIPNVGLTIVCTVTRD